MAISDERLRELAQQMAEAMGMAEKARRRSALQVLPGGGSRKGATKPALRVVEGKPAGMDVIERESHLRFIRSMRRAYRHVGMDLIINQATLGKGTIDDLTDQELVQLHRDMDRARDCLRDDISFEDAGLIRHPPQESDACWG